MHHTLPGFPEVDQRRLSSPADLPYTDESNSKDFRKTGVGVNIQIHTDPVHTQD